MNDPKSVFTTGYTHSASKPCLYCPEEGICSVCNGSGLYHVGCGGPAEVDLNHSDIGAYCRGCNGFVPALEVTLGNPDG